MCQLDSRSKKNGQLLSHPFVAITRMNVLDLHRFLFGIIGKNGTQPACCGLRNINPRLYKKQAAQLQPVVHTTHDMDYALYYCRLNPTSA